MGQEGSALFFERVVGRCSGGWDEVNVGSATSSRRMSQMAGYLSERRYNILQNVLKMSAGAGAIIGLLLLERNIVAPLSIFIQESR